MTQVLARKWRPQNFNDLVGQEHISQALTYALNQKRLHHAYLFTGTRGVGKTTIARIFAKSINCLTNGISAEPCGKCEHCLEIERGFFPDLIEIDAASRTGVDDTREILENVPYAAVKGRFKVYLIDEVHMFSRSSFNALLKTLEEPPEHVKFILATTDPQKIPATIISRCLQFQLKNIKPEFIIERCQQILQQEKIPFENEALQIIAENAQGSMRDALSILDQVIIFSQGKITSASTANLLGAIPEKSIILLLQNLSAYNAHDLRKLLLKIDEANPDYNLFLKKILEYLQKITVLQLNAQQKNEYFSPELQQLAQQIPIELLQLWYQILSETWQSMPYQPDLRLSLEMGLLRALALRPIFASDEVQRLKTIPEALPIPEIMEKQKQNNISAEALPSDYYQNGDNFANQALPEINNQQQNQKNSQQENIHLINNPVEQFTNHSLTKAAQDLLQAEIVSVRHLNKKE